MHPGDPGWDRAPEGFVCVSSSRNNRPSDLCTKRFLCRVVDPGRRFLAQIVQGLDPGFPNLRVNGINLHGGDLPQVTPLSYQMVGASGEHHLNQMLHHRRPMKVPNQPGIQVQSPAIIKEARGQQPGEQARPATDGVL